MCVHVLYLLSRRRPCIHMCTSQTQMIPPLPIFVPSTSCPIVLGYAICTSWHLKSNILPCLIITLLTVRSRCWQESLTLSSLPAFLSTARRKPDRKDEPSKIPLIRKTGDVPNLALVFLLKHPSRVVLAHSSDFSFIFPLMSVVCYFFTCSGTWEQSGGWEIAAAAL